MPKKCLFARAYAALTAISMATRVLITVSSTVLVKLVRKSLLVRMMS